MKSLFRLLIFGAILWCGWRFLLPPKENQLPPTFSSKDAKEAFLWLLLQTKPALEVLEGKNDILTEKAIEDVNKGFLDLVGKTIQWKCLVESISREECTFRLATAIRLRELPLYFSFDGDPQGRDWKNNQFSTERNRLRTMGLWTDAGWAMNRGEFHTEAVTPEVRELRRGDTCVLNGRIASVRLLNHDTISSKWRLHISLEDDMQVTTIDQERAGKNKIVDPFAEYRTLNSDQSNSTGRTEQEGEEAKLQGEAKRLGEELMGQYWLKVGDSSYILDVSKPEPFLHTLYEVRGLVGPMGDGSSYHLSEVTKLNGVTWKTDFSFTCAAFRSYSRHGWRPWEEGWRGPPLPHLTLIFENGEWKKYSTRQFRKPQIQDIPQFRDEARPARWFGQ